MTSPYHYSPDSLARAWGEPLAAARLRQQPEDFVVVEELGFEPAGEGEHLWLWVEKRACTSDWVARHLARLAGVTRRDVGFAGQKDRHALTRQWFSIHLPTTGEIDGQALSAVADPARGEHIRLLRQTRHRRKLRRGQHRGNRFALVLRHCQADPGAMEERLQRIATTGVPNYFGEQRFGRAGDNVMQFLRQASHARRRRIDSILISAARSWLFNALLSERVRQGDWHWARAGDVLMLAGSRSHFLCREVDEDMERRLASGDISPSGPLWGRGEPPTAGEVQRQERALAAAHPELCRALEIQGLAQERRSLRLAVEELQWHHSGDTLRLSFFLARGGFATTVVREVVSTG